MFFFKYTGWIRRLLDCNGQPYLVLLRKLQIRPAFEIVRRSKVLTVRYSDTLNTYKDIAPDPDPGWLMEKAKVS